MYDGEEPTEWWAKYLGEIVGAILGLAMGALVLYGYGPWH